MDHHELGPGGGIPPTKRVKLDSATSETAGKPGGLDDLQIIGERKGANWWRDGCARCKGESFICPVLKCL